MAGVVIEVEFGLCTEVIVATDDGVIELLVVIEVGVGLALADAEVLDDDAPAAVFLRLPVKPRLASARDKLALTDSRLKLISPLKLLGTLKPGKPSIFWYCIFLGGFFFIEISNKLDSFHNLFIIAQQLWTT